MSENLIISTARQGDLVAAIEGLGVAVETQTLGNAQMLTCRKDKARVDIRISQPSDWASAPVLRDHAIAVVMMDPVGSLLRRGATRQFRDEVVAACGPFVVAQDALVERARAASGGQDASSSSTSSPS